MMSLDEYKELFGDIVDTEKTFYETFLIQTDHIPNKIIENFIETMVDDNVNMGSMKNFFKEVKMEYGDILLARKMAREEINRLEMQMGE